MIKGAIYKSVYLEFLAGDDSLVSFGTGCIIQDDNGLHLCTTWHLVTGSNFLDPSNVIVQKPRVKVKLWFPIIRNIEDEEFDYGRNFGGTAALYDSNNNPLWIQDAINTNVQPINTGVRIVDVPILDVVIMEDLNFNGVEEISKDLFSIDSNMIMKGHNTPNILYSAEVVTVGYPYGYGAADKINNDAWIQEPAHICSRVSVKPNNNHSIILLQDRFVPGCSGSPTYIQYQNKISLLGLYIGALCPDGIVKEVVNPSGTRPDLTFKFGIIHLIPFFK